jgi:hypothetical protein
MFLRRGGAIRRRVSDPRNERQAAGGTEKAPRAWNRGASAQMREQALGRHASTYWRRGCASFAGGAAFVVFAFGVSLAASVGGWTAISFCTA